jgi:hypothetical protein
MKPCGTLLCILLTLGTSLRAEAPSVLVDKLTLTVCQFLEDIGSRTIPENKKKHILKTYLTTRYLRGVVVNCLDAGELNPSGGPPLEAGIKLLSAAYGESGFYAAARYVNKNGSTDAGIMQVNSVHWWGKSQVHPTWGEFCDKLGYTYDLAKLWKPRINIQFAAIINEMLAQQHQRTYRFNYWKRPDQQKLYKLLQQAIK